MLTDLLTTMGVEVQAATFQRKPACIGRHSRARSARPARQGEELTTAFRAQEPTHDC
jgi:hypothetical protein